jgi:hypothetical protein
LLSGIPGLPHPQPLPIAPTYHWRGAQGHRTITKIVEKLIPQWKNDLYPAQHNLVARIPDGEDIMCSMATGGGNFTLFSVPILILREIAPNPHPYPDLPTRTLSQGIVTYYTNEGPCY